MKEVEIQLLIKDLCARLPYGVKCLVNFDDGTNDIMTLQTGLPNGFGNWDFYNENCSGCSNNFKPYLRPISSMTVEEDCEFCRLFKCDSVNAMYGYINWAVGGSCDYDDFDIEFSKLAKIIDWLNAHHFDYRGLIEKGLALEAPEGMYK